MSLIFLTGPVRSGKSRRAVELVTTCGADVVFVATYRAAADDAEMTERVRRHRAERPPGWRTLEAPDDVGAALLALRPAPSAVVLDCLTLWLSARLDWPDDAIVTAWAHVLEQFRRASWPVVIVGNEVGWGLVPESALARRFRDLVGTLAQRTAAAADEAWLMIAGQPLRLK